jgi:GAF domain-containing protein
VNEQAYRSLLEENARLQAKTQTLQRLLHLFGAPDDFGTVFEGLMDIAMDVFNAHSGALYIFDDEQEGLYFAAARGPKAKEVLALDITIKPGQGIAGSAFQNNEVIAVSDAYKDPRFSREVSDAVGYEVRSMLTTPIVCDGQPLGALQVINKKTGTASSFTSEEVEFARQLGRVAGSLISLGVELQALRAQTGR